MSILAIILEPTIADYIQASWKRWALFQLGQKVVSLGIWAHEVHQNTSLHIWYSAKTMRTTQRYIYVFGPRIRRTVMSWHYCTRVWHSFDHWPSYLYVSTEMNESNMVQIKNRRPLESDRKQPGVQCCYRFNKFVGENTYTALSRILLWSSPRSTSFRIEDQLMN